MPDPRLAPETELLQDVTIRCASRYGPSDVAVYDALERGFARLVFLESQLRLRDDVAGSGSFERDELHRQIVSLRDALTALRRRTVGRDTSLLAIGGFVLPSADAHA